MIGDDDDAPARWVDDPESEPGALLRQLPEPAPWSAARKQRLRAALDGRLRSPSRHLGRALLWSTLAAAGFVAGLGVGLGRRPPAPDLAAPLRPAVAIAPAVVPPLVVARGRAELRGDRVLISDGSVIVAARATPIRIEVPAQRTSVRAAAGGVVEVRLIGWRVQVSAYHGAAEIETSEQPIRVLAPGRTLGAGGERPIEPTVAAEIERALGVESPAPIDREVAPSPSPPPPSPSPSRPHRPPPMAAAPPSEKSVAVAAPIAAAPKLPLDDDAPAPPAASVPAAPTPTAPAPPAASVPAAPTPTAPSPLPTPTAPSAPPPSALAREAEELRAAMQRLRHDHDPAGALLLLDRYLRAYPRGVLRTDAELARIDALLQTGDRGRALAALDHLPLDGLRLPRARELRLTRGELRAEAGRCRDALGDLGPATDGSDELAERALYRQAVCRARLGDGARARAGLEAYLRRFPGGRFAAETRRALEAN